MGGEHQFAIARLNREIKQLQEIVENLTTRLIILESRDVTCTPLQPIRTNDINVYLPTRPDLVYGPPITKDQYVEEVLRYNFESNNPKE